MPVTPIKFSANPSPRQTKGCVAVPMLHFEPLSHLYYIIIDPKPSELRVIYLNYWDGTRKKIPKER